MPPTAYTNTDKETSAFEGFLGSLGAVQKREILPIEPDRLVKEENFDNILESWS